MIITICDNSTRRQLGKYHSPYDSAVPREGEVVAMAVNELVDRIPTTILITGVVEQVYYNYRSIRNDQHSVPMLSPPDIYIYLDDVERKEEE